MKRVFVFFLFLFIFLLTPRISFAETIHNFDVNILAHQDGTMDVQETISYDFENASRHGIYRYIPLYSAVGDLYRIIKIEDISVQRDSQSEKFSVTTSSEKVNIKIGNPDQTIRGSHIYTISYKVFNGVGSNFEDHDEIYWNATGNDWPAPIEKASVQVQTDFELDASSLICFEGPAGSKNQTCNIFTNQASSSRVLDSGSGLTIVAIYPPNTFSKSILSKNPPQSTVDTFFSFIFKNYLYVLFILNLILAPILIYWYFKHKNKKRFGPPAPNFDFPEDEEGQILKPALAGTIDNARLEANDIIATIFDLAIKRYIRIEQIKIKIKFFPDSTDQKIIKLKNADASFNVYEKILFDKLFEDGDSIKTSKLNRKFYSTFSKIEKAVFQILIEKNYYTKNPKTQKTLLLILAIFSLGTLNVILGAVLIFLAIKLNGRTPLGDEVDFKVDGLKIFLKSMVRNYKWQAERFYTVEKMIPYAIAFGFINEFMDQLKTINPNYTPTWYTGYSGSFYANYAVAYSGFTSNFAPSSSSGASGGFSGGGGGGGGGGSW